MFQASGEDILPITMKFGRKKQDDTKQVENHSDNKPECITCGFSPGNATSYCDL
jgi:hypothetical protein